MSPGDGDEQAEQCDDKPLHDDHVDSYCGRYNEVKSFEFRIVLILWSLKKTFYYSFSIAYNLLVETWHLNILYIQFLIARHDDVRL